LDGVKLGNFGRELISGSVSDSEAQTVYLPKIQLEVMLEKKNKDLEPDIAKPVVFAIFILATIVLLIWMAS